MKKFKRRKICIVSSTRADFGILSGVIKSLQKEKSFDTKLFLTGSHLEDKYGLTFHEASKKNFKIFKKVRILSKRNDSLSLLKNSEKILNKFAKELKKLSPNLIILLGDRYEIFCIAYCAFILGVPIAHLYGGELTQNSLDDSMRHAITKLSDFHFVSTNRYFKRVIQLGEDKKNIFNIGSVSLDEIDKFKFLNKKEIEKKLRVNFKKRIIICTMHPETNNLKNINKQVSILLNSLKKIQSTSVVFTMPNDDLGSDLIRAKIKKFCISNKNAFYFKSLGKDIYFSLIKISNLVLGNSSSGIIESPSLGTYSINLGLRQLGRTQSKSIFNINYEKKKIEEAIYKIFKLKKKKIHNPYFKRNSVRKFISILKKLDFNSIQQKKFIDIL